MGAQAAMAVGKVQPMTGPEILLIEDVFPGAPVARGSGEVLDLHTLREFLARVAEEGGAGHLPDDPPPEAGESFDLPMVGTVIALRGGLDHHLRYTLPMLAALRLPAHLFLAIEQLGAGDGWSLEDLESCAGNPSLCIDLDLSGIRFTRSRDLADQLARAARLFEEHAGSRPYYAWVPGPPRDGRLGLLLAQHEFAGVVSLRFERHYVQERLWMWAAKRPGWRTLGAWAYR